MKPGRILLVLAAMVLPLASHAQTRILIESSGGAEARGLAGIVERCAVLALERAGFAPARGSGAGEDPPEALLLCSSSLAAGGYELSLELRSAAEGQALLAEARLSGPLTLDLDERLIEEVSALVALSGLEPGPPPAPRPAVASLPGDAAPRAGAAAPASASAEAPVLARAPAGGEAVLMTGPVPISAGGEALVIPQSGGPPALSRLGLGLSTAPVLVVGAASDYFRFGFDASCSLGYSFRFGSFSLEAGLRAGYALLYSAGQVGGEVHLASLGPEFRGRWPAEGRLSAFLRAGLGPLYLAVAPETGETLGKILPACSAGLGLEFLPSPGFSLGLEVGLLAVFERNLPLLGLAPGLVAAWRL